MNVQDMEREVGATVIHRGASFERGAIRHVVACDLMSDVLVADRHDHLLVTSLASDQVIRTADIVGASAVLLVNGKTIPDSMTRLAKSLHMTLMSSPLPKYEACVALGRLLQP